MRPTQALHLVAALWAAGSAPGPLPAQPVERFDTVASAGEAIETNPLLVYGTPVGVQLVAANTVLYAHGSGGVLTLVDLISGEGWQIRDEGRRGPGEFGGRLPFFGEGGGRIHAVAQDGQTAVRDLGGRLLETGRHAEPVFGGDLMVFPKGLLRDGTFVVHVNEPPGSGRMLRQALRAHGPDGRLLWSYDNLPALVVRPSGRLDARDGGGPVVAHARHGTVAVARNGGTEVAALDAEGAVRARARMPDPVWDVRVDADERVWVQLRSADEPPGGSRRFRYRVHDRELRALFTTPVLNVLDARGDQVVATGFDDSGAQLLHLLERRGASRR